MTLVLWMVNSKYLAFVFKEKVVSLQSVFRKSKNNV